MVGLPTDTGLSADGDDDTGVMAGDEENGCNGGGAPAGDAEADGA